MIHSYKLGGYNIVVDAASGAIHMVDDAAYDTINAYSKSGRGLNTASIANHHNIGETEILEVITDIEELKKQGKLFSEEIEITPEHTQEHTIKALCLNVSHQCNMTCGYCFADKGEYGGSGELMPLDTALRAIEFLVENSGGRRNLEVDFFGGEPLLNWEVVKGVVKYARKVEGQQKFRFTLTTNGLLIDDEVIEFCNREMHNVVLSLDGRRETHNRMRKLSGVESCYDAVLDKIKRMVEMRGGKDYYIRGTYTRNNLDFTSDILHIADLGFTELSMEPVVASNDAKYALRREDLPEIEGQYVQLAEEMIKRRHEGRGFTFYHYILELKNGPCVHKRNLGCGSGVEYLAVTPRGELYPCHQFVGNPQFLMGNIQSGVTNESLRKAFTNTNIQTRSDCRSCWARMYCSGGCAANAYNDSGNIAGIHQLGCEIFKKRLECAIYIKIAEAYGANS